MSTVRQPPRSAQQRKRDTLARLERDIDAWVASADPHGDPYLVPLWYPWDGAALTMATAASTPTGRNLRATGRVRLGIGAPDDVVLIQGTVETVFLEDVPAELADAFAARPLMRGGRGRGMPASGSPRGASRRGVGSTSSREET